MVAEFEAPGDRWGGNCTAVHVHNLWKNLLIRRWGREVTGNE